MNLRVQFSGRADDARAEVDPFGAVVAEAALQERGSARAEDAAPGDRRLDAPARTLLEHRPLGGVAADPGARVADEAAATRERHVAAERFALLAQRAERLARAAPQRVAVQDAARVEVVARARLAEVAARIEAVPVGVFAVE